MYSRPRFVCSFTGSVLALLSSLQMTHEIAQEVFTNTFVTELSAASFPDHVITLAPSLAAASLDIAVAGGKALSHPSNAAAGGRVACKTAAVEGKEVEQDLEDDPAEGLSCRPLHATQQLLQVTACPDPFKP